MTPMERIFWMGSSAICTRSAGTMSTGLPANDADGADLLHGLFRDLHEIRWHHVNGTAGG